MEKPKYIKVRHKKCGSIWEVTRNAIGLLYCNLCKSKDGFEMLKEVELIEVKDGN